MTAGRQVIDATRLDGAITSVPGGVAVGGTRVPLEDVAVLLMGSATTISGGALTKLARYQVIVLNCDWRGVPDLVAVTYGSPLRSNSRLSISSASRECADRPDANFSFRKESSSFSDKSITSDSS